MMDVWLMMTSLSCLGTQPPSANRCGWKYHSAVRSIWLERMGLSIGLPAAEPVRVTLVTLVTPEFWSVVPAKSWFSVVCACNWLKSGREMPVPSAKRYCSSLLCFQRRFRLGKALV